jgi:hypothetical protein
MEKKMSKNALRSEKKERENTMQIRLSEDEFVLYRSAADHKGVSLSAWARLALSERALSDLERAKEVGLIGAGLSARAARARLALKETAGSTGSIGSTSQKGA